MTGNHVSTVLAACLTVCALAAAAPSPAQERDTGRRKPGPEEQAQQAEEAPEPRKEDGFEPRWHLGTTFGLQGGSDLFRVETADGGPMSWESVSGPFNASRFTATFDQDLCLGLFLARDMGTRWSLRGDVSYSRMDVAAEALTGQFGVIYRYDRMDVVQVGLGADVRLTGAVSYPFLDLAVVTSILSSAHFPELDQTNLGGRLGLGYLQRFTEEVALRLEGRWTVSAFDAGDFRPPTTLPGDPEVRFDGESNVQFFEIMIGVEAAFGL